MNNLFWQLPTANCKLPKERYLRILLMSMPDTVPQFTEKTWRAPSLAMSNIAGNLEGHDVYIADLVLKRSDLKQSIEDVIRDYRPELIGLSAMSFQFKTAERIAGFIKKLDGNIKIAIGGYHATLMYEEICNSENGEPSDSRPFDFVVRGEGDIAFRELVDALNGKMDIGKVKGVSFKDNGSFRHNVPRPLEDLENIRLPNRSVRIWKGYTFSGKKLDMIESSRGCTMTCKFCSMNRMYGRSFRKYKIERIIKDISNAREQGAAYIAFADDNITLDIKRFEGLAQAIIDAGHNEINYIVQASSAGIASSSDLAAKMAEAGFKIVFLGIENVSKRNLALMNKGDIVDKTIKAVELLHKNNILIVGGMILGHADDSETEIAENFEFFDRLNIDFYGEQIITPYPKTQTREELLMAGLITNKDNISKYNGYWANVRTNRLSSDDLQFLRWKYKRRYSTFFKTTPVFKANYPLVYLIRLLLLRPYYRLKNLIVSLMNSERRIFDMEMRRYIEMNEFSL